MKISKKDKELIASEHIGKSIRSSFPVINRLLDHLSDDEDVKNVITGSGALKLLERIRGKKADK